MVIVCFIGNLGFSLSLLLKYDKFASTINCLKSSSNGFFHNYFYPIKIINFPTSFRNIFTGQEKSDKPNTLSNFHTLLLGLIWDEIIFNSSFNLNLLSDQTCVLIFFIQILFREQKIRNYRCLLHRPGEWVASDINDS